MRKRPTGKKLDNPVPSRAVTGASTRSSQSWALAPNTTPAAPRPTIPKKSRRPTGEPTGVPSIPRSFRARIAMWARGARNSPTCEFSPVDALGRQVGGDALGDSRERVRCFAVRLGGHDGAPLIAALTQRRHQRHLSDERHLELVGQVLAAVASEDLVA